MSYCLSTEPAASLRGETLASADPHAVVAPSRKPAQTAPQCGTPPLCLAQRAFSALLEDSARDHASMPALRGAQLRNMARRTLSALSADDRPRLVRWLALQVASAHADLDDSPLRRVDALLESRVAAVLSRTREELAQPRQDTDTAAA